MLNQETDALEDNNRHIDLEIEMYQNMAKMSEQQKITKIKQLHEQMSEIEGLITNTHKESDDMQQEFNSIKDNVAKMVNLFLEAKFSANIASRMSYNNDTHFNEGNILSYLSELEEYISNLITILAYKREDPNAAISSVPLEKLNQKEFAKKEIQIDAPIDHEIQTEAMTQLGDEHAHLGDEHYNIINSNDLYTRFNEFREKGLIKFIG